MPPRPYPIDAHETRVQRLEDTAAEVREDVARQGAQLDAINRRLDHLTDQVNLGFDKLGEGIDRVAELVGKVSEKVQGLDARLVVLETAEGRRKAWWKAAGKIAFPVVVAVVLAFLGFGG